ncbi:DUF4306 domain-containing protein [Radiobacillus deserti]|uniref:DUF4306 domain-containing protein n=1 Tax=Radiobacillus deserti TaxID=2594883 RepID=A0A516KFQ3_9BACI|nr:DUF4306 domain-containing protein [Radiobacillus deserti]QDP40234.1 DUF4306 domain-containing protein [Radiobacillus deserti]
MKYLFSYGLTIVVLLISTFVSWYEGSAIRLNPWEWKYTAFFSTWWHGEIKSEADIVQLDHFLYAAKFAPFFPFLMFASASFVVALTLYLTLKDKKFVVSLFSMCMIYAFIGICLRNADTIGGQLFEKSCYCLGALYFLSAIHSSRRIPNVTF